MKNTKLVTALTGILGMTSLGIQTAEAGDVITVNSISDQPENGLTTLREAIELSNTASGVEINFDPQVFSSPQTITLENGDMIITEAMTIAGPGADLLTIDGNNSSRIFTLDDGNSQGAFTVRIQDITLTNGNGDSSIESGSGGCIYSNERLRLSSAVIKNCSASREGGGVRMNRAGNIVENSVFLNNTSVGRGGGLAHQSSVGSSIIGSTFSGNRSDSRGGGISVTQTGSFDVINSTFSNNEAPIGAGISAESAININNSTIYRNQGQGINLTEDNIQNSIIALNTGGDCVFRETGFNNITNFDGDGSCGATPTRGVFNDPLLSPLADNGGLTPTHLPLLGSPVIDSGFDDVCEDLDQRGLTRPIDGDGDEVARCDIGAVEFDFKLGEIIFKDGFD